MKDVLPVEAAPEPVLQIGDASLPEPADFELDEAEKAELRGVQAQLQELSRGRAVLRAGDGEAAAEVAAAALLAFDEYREDGLALVDLALVRLGGPRVAVLPLHMLATAQIREDYGLQARLLQLEAGAGLVLLPVALEAGRQHCGLAVFARRLHRGLWTVADPLGRFSEAHPKARALAAWLAMCPFQQVTSWTYLPLPPLPQRPAPRDSPLHVMVAAGLVVAGHAPATALRLAAARLQTPLQCRAARDRLVLELARAAGLRAQHSDELDDLESQLLG